MEDQPYLSVVVAARNDNYGGDFEQRLQNCVNWFCYYADLFQLNSEFLIVNYNPIKERMQLTDAIQFPKSNFVKFRIVTVPNSFHEKISDEKIRKKVPLYEYVAKNIGIRRARGEFIVSGNPDVLWDPSYFEYMCKKDLSKDIYYRADRADYANGLTNISPGMESLSLVRSSVFHYFKKGFRYDYSLTGIVSLKIAMLELRNRCRLFYNLFIFEHEKLANRFNLHINYDNVEYRVHTNASGDFFMMHRNNWARLKGHPENTYLSIHTDALSIVMARYSGLREKVFFCPVYHRDHARRFDAEKNDESITAMYRKFETEGKWMESNNKPIIYNDDNWGFPNEAFEVIEL